MVGRRTQKVPLGSFSMFWTRAELVWCNPTIGSAERRQTLQRRANSGLRGLDRQGAHRAAHQSSSSQAGANCAKHPVGLRAKGLSARRE